MLKNLYGENKNFSNPLEKVYLNDIKKRLDEKDRTDWEKCVVNFPKLRTYRLFKTTFGREIYTEHFLSKNKRSILAQIRTGSSFLRVETGRYERQISPTTGKLEKPTSGKKNMQNL